MGMVLFALLAVGPAAATAQQSGLAGVVTDNTGGVLPGVTVEASGPTLPGGPSLAVTDGGRSLRPVARARRLPCHVHAAGLRAAGARGRAGRYGHRDPRRQPRARWPLRGGDGRGDRNRHRGPRHQHAPRGHGGQPGHAGAAGLDAARRPLPQSQRQPRRGRRAQQLVQLQPAGDPHGERREARFRPGSTSSRPTTASRTTPRAAVSRCR